MPLPIDQLADVDAVIVTHLHGDYWDKASRVEQGVPVFAQNEEDADTIGSQGFADVRVLTENSSFPSISLAKPGGQHGTDETMKAIPALGHVCGVVFSTAWRLLTSNASFPPETLDEIRNAATG
ncbi:hypothetical protein LP421_03090 (plasmid) [Rhizobium sp. RCAM05350]|nr:hypothetical protein LP421_03090 [Rhizobium sp. RCAM05350]